MSHIEKEKLIKADIASIENRVRHAFNQGYDLGFKDGKSKQPNCSEIPTGSTTKNCRTCRNFGSHHGICEICKDNKCWTEKEPTTKNDLGVDAISRADARSLICKIDIKHRMLGMSRKVFKDLYNGMDELPPVTPQESKTGHWIEHPHEAGPCWEYSRYECSECHDWAEDDSDYCPYCGAKMFEPQESEDNNVSI